MDRNINIIVGLNGERIVLINDIRFKGRKREDWKKVEDYLKEYVRIATNRKHSENKKKKHEKNAKYGWYRYDVRFALPVYEDKNGEVYRYNIFFARMLVRHDADGKKYLYDLLAIKKETSSPLE
ncbi:MAG: hypothetical protein K2M20_06190 [Lachnospiraceae bacterium]|nr:hypothetical protein [Lachnospiraceae bacterium]